MPTYSCSYPSKEQQARKRKRRQQFEAKARAKGIMEGSNGWNRYLAAHHC